MYTGSMSPRARGNIVHPADHSPAAPIKTTRGQRKPTVWIANQDLKRRRRKKIQSSLPVGSRYLGSLSRGLDKDFKRGSTYRHSSPWGLCGNQDTISGRIGCSDEVKAQGPRVLPVALIKVNKDAAGFLTIQKQEQEQEQAAAAI